jgi:signal transduction histidine kinase
VNSFLQGKTKSIKNKLIDDEDGMRHKECDGPNRSFLSKDGIVVVTTLDGLSFIDPAKERGNSLAPPVYITNFLTDQGNLLDSNGEYLIEPGNLRYTFNFTAINFLGPKKLRFKYKLEGIDKDWVESANERSAHYTNLPAGKYTFKVIASNNDGTWNENGDSLQFEVKPYLYATMPFIVISSTLILFIMYAIYIIRIKRIKKSNDELTKLNKELDRFVYSASHDLKAPLTSILGLIQLARLDKSSEKAEEYFNLIEKSINKMEFFIKDIIDYSRNSRLEITCEAIPINNMVHDIFDELQYLDNTHIIRRELEIIGYEEFYSDKKRINIILNNLINNSIKYQNFNQMDPFVKVKFEVDKQFCQIEVSDNGIGIHQEHLGKIFNMFYRANEQSKGSGLGLYIVMEVVEKLGGSILVKSEPGKGSLFSIKLPVGQVKEEIEEKRSYLKTLTSGISSLWF